MPDPVDPDRSILDALMAEEGVRPLDRRSPPRTGSGHGPPRPKKAATPKVQAVSAVVQGGPTEADLATARADVQRLTSQLAESRDALAAAVSRLEATETRLAAAERDRDAFDGERRALARQCSKLAAEPTQSTDPPLLGSVLDRRGVLRTEQAEALAAMLLELPDQTLAALEAGDTGALPRLLEDRLALLCASPSCASDVDRVAVLTVPPERCEVCGGSDTAAAYHCFVAACQTRNLARIVLVGGSPNYRRQLRELAASRRSGIRLDLVDGTTKPLARRVKSMARTADLVVIWSATLVDHATTNAFEASGVSMVTVPLRGIGRMLRWLAEYVEGMPLRS